MDKSFLAVEGINKEMTMAEDELLGRGLNWWETYTDCVVPVRYFAVEHADVEENDEASKITKLSSNFHGLPIKQILLENMYPCSIYSINWVYSKKKSNADINFYSDGKVTIKTDKVKRKDKDIFGMTRYCYSAFEAEYNTISTDVTIKYLSEDEHNRKDKYAFSLSDIQLCIGHNGFEVKEDLVTGGKSISFIKCGYKNKICLFFQVTIDKDGRLTNGRLLYNTFNGIGRVNGTYQFTYDSEKGIRKADWYSRKGKNTDLLENDELLGDFCELLFGEDGEFDYEFILLMYKFTQAVVNGCGDYLDLCYIDSIKKDVYDFLKELKAEVVLPGLVTRLKNGIKLLKSQGFKLNLEKKE